MASIPGSIPMKPGSTADWLNPVDKAKRAVPLNETPQNPDSGSLVIIDTFEDSAFEASHGNTAAFAARQHGFRGQIYAEKIGDDNKIGAGQADANFTFLQGRPLKPETVRKTVANYTRHAQRELLEDVTGDLNKLRGKGLKDSAVNISFGTHPERLADQIYRQVRSAPRQEYKGGSGIMGSLVVNGGNNQYHLAQNILNGYGIDQDKFYSADPKVSGPERLKLQQSLLDVAEAGRKDPDVIAAKKEYDQAVKNIEKNNNSVVISVGNEGKVLKEFAQDANGSKVKSQPDSGLNVLVNSDVTTVGSTRWFNDGSERIAKYSSKDPETDIYASGAVGNGKDPNKMNVYGTSFAAPRVAGTMASLHGNHPGMPSSSVENLMRNRLTHEVEGEKVLGFKLAEEYMRKGTF